MFVFQFPFSVTLHEKSAVPMSDTFPQAFPTCNITGTTTNSTSSTTPSTSSTNFSENPPVTTDYTSKITCTSINPIESDSVSPETISDTSTSSVIPGNCFCLQKCTPIMNLTELQETIELIVRNLTVSKTVTSKYRRRFVSADDNRPSAQAMGTVALVFIACVIVTIVLLDHSVIVYKIMVKVVMVWNGNNVITVGEITRIHVQHEQATTSTV